MKSLKELSLNLPEEQYHNLPVWSHSVIAKYARDGFDAIATLHDRTEPTASMEFGSLFDSILTKGKKTLEEYVVVETKVPDAEKKALNFISSYTSDKFDDLTPEFIASKCDECQYQTRWKIDTRIEHLAPYKDYFDAKVSGKKIVSSEDWNDAIEMARIFRNDAYLKDLFGTKSTNDIEYIYQSQFQVDYTLDSGETVKLKIMPDLLVVNHKDKTILPVDLKTSAMPAYSFAENFIRFRYDIQASLYTDVLQKVLNDEPDYWDYTILPYLFTDISRVDKCPVTYKYDPRDDSQKNGLCIQSKYGDRTIQYKGWKQCLSEILEYEKSNAKVPSYITVSGPNDLLTILSSR